MARIYLANGHGIKPSGTYDPGASGGGWTEQSAGDTIVSLAAAKLRDWGVDVKDEAYKDDPNYIGSARAANDWGADYLVAIHHDWNQAPAGHFGHWYSEAGHSLADDIRDAMNDAGFPHRADWHKRRTELYVLSHTDAPAALYEVGRIGDYSREQLQQIGMAVAEGIATHIELDITTEEEPDMSAEHDLLVSIAEKLDRMQQQVDKVELMASIDSFDENVVEARDGLMISLLRGDGEAKALDRIDWLAKAKAARDEYRKSRGV